MGIKALIYGCAGTALSHWERAFFSKHQPWGFILFGRNVDTPDQVCALVNDLREIVDHDQVPILIDQEGGRVQRMKPPHWPVYLPGRRFGELYRHNKEQGLRAAWLQSRLMAFDLRQCGINVNCLPVLDVPVPGGHGVIGDRAYADRPDVVAKIGLSAANGLLAGGVLPVVKHVPGHGRASADSHKSLPVVDTDPAVLAATDFQPFHALRHLPLAMSAHVVYSALDPESPATTSRTVIGEIIRKRIGFNGLLMSDDISMQALSGDFSKRTEQAFAAGCDVVLHCNGVKKEMQAVANAALELNGKALERSQKALAMLVEPQDCNEGALRDEFHKLCEIKL